MILPVSAVIPTLDHRERLLRTIGGLLQQSDVPCEIVIVDASTSPITGADLPPAPAGVSVRCIPATQRGAAVQRNEGIAAVRSEFVLFIDDDIDVEPGCVAALWRAMSADQCLGACSALMTNQYYRPPGIFMRSLYALLGCPATGSLAGRCCGPALNFLPEYAESGRPGQPVEWLNLGCTLYRRAAMPAPPLLPHFEGYSLMEDAALSLHVAKSWKLRVEADARVNHDSGTDSYKARVFRRERMELINRWFVMRCILGRDGFIWDLRQLAYQFLMPAISLRIPGGWRRFPAALAGKVAGLATVLLRGHRWRGYPETSES